MAKQEGDNNVQKFFKYLSKPLPIGVIDTAYIHNGIIFERSDFYCDFILTLHDLILTTYLGDDLTNHDEQINHFNWCWDKTCLDLRHDNINLISNGKVYKYFMNYFFDTFYLIPNKGEEKDNINNLPLIWDFLFDYNVEKSRSELDTYITVYKLFEKSFVI